MSETEVRRSVRATKGQHKALEAQDQPIEAPKRRGKKNKKAAPEPEEPEEEIIRCVCGATEQDEDSGEPWIACDTCGAWQHNICMGMSQYTEDLPKEYFCEQCRPENHKELLAGMERGEKPWEARRKAYEEEKTEKKKRGGKKGTKKRASDPKEEVAQPSQKSKQSPAKQSPAPEPKKESKSTAGQKRKVVDSPADKESKQAQKIRKVSETQSVPVDEYTPPDDLAAKIAELSDIRQGPAKALSKSLVHSIGILEKKGTYTASDGVTVASRAERLALQIERAVHDTHPVASNYSSQIRTLAFNLKTNMELCTSLLNHSLSPNTIAMRSTEQLATKEHQKEVTEMKAKAEKQAVKITDPNLRIIRKTHKGDEIVGDEGFTSEAVPTGPAPRPAGRDKSEPLRKAEGEERRVSVAHSGHSRSPTRDLAIDTQQSPSRADFDINKVFSSVKSPTISHNRRPSAAAPASGPGIDADVDRMLEDGTQSPPYSPCEDVVDPDVVWSGNLVMNTIAEVQVVAKHMGGAKLIETIGLSWEKLIPKTLTVCGRIDEQQAITYLCGLRYSLPTDIVVVSLEPTSDRAKANMQKLIDYFVSKKRYGVIGDKGIANVRDTYLVPVLPGSGNHPEFMMNLGDNFLPEARTEPVMLAVFVYRNEQEVVQRVQASAAFNNSARLQETVGASFAHSPGTPTPSQPAGLAANLVRSNRQSVSAPAFSPTSPQGTFPNYPTPRNSHTPSQQGLPPTPTPHNPNPLGYARQDQLQRQSEQVAREVLGSLITSPTVGFLLPQADQMTRKEWEVIKRIYERDPKARDDLPHLSSVLEKQTAESASSQTSHSQAQPQPQVHGQQPAPALTPAPAPPRPHPPQVQTQAQTQTQPSPQIHQHQQAPHPQPQHHPQPTAIRNTPIPPPPIPPTMASRHQPPVRQTPIPPPPIPPQAMPAATPVHPPNPPA